MSDELSPVITTLNAPFWEAAERGELLLPWCETTRQYYWPPGPRSPFDIHTRIAWRPARTGGRLTDAVIYRRGFMKSFEPVMPYAIGLVELDDGPRLLVHLRDVALAAPEQAGAQVQIFFESILLGSPKMPMAARQT